MIWNIPNILTIVRLLAAPALALVFLFLAAPLAEWLALILFVGASMTDYVDGYLARAWKQESKFGAMLDPIADKGMVVVALLMLTALYGLNPLILLPATLIVFREVFVSGLREFLGSDAKLLQVTRLAKWKTASQMVAIAVLLSRGLFQHYLGMQSFGMDEAMLADVLTGVTPDTLGLVWKYQGMVLSYNIGLGLLWISTALTLVTGGDYFLKAMPFLKEESAND